MSIPDPLGPFPEATPKPPVESVHAPVAAQDWPTRLEYLRAFNYVFENPNWMLNLLWSFVCGLVGQIIPIVPAMVFMGYQFEAVEVLLANRGTRYPDFDTNRIGDYLTRGIWVVLLFLLALMITMLVIACGIGAIVALAFAANGVQDDFTAPAIFFGGLAVVIVGLGLYFALLTIVMTPMMLRSGLTQEFGAAFDFGWVRHFIGKMWFDTLMTELFIITSVFGLVLVTCGLAGIVLGPLMPFVQMHFLYQLYAIYLSRGGIPIPVKPRLPPVAQQPYLPPPPY